MNITQPVPALFCGRPVSPLAPRPGHRQVLGTHELDIVDADEVQEPAEMRFHEIDALACSSAHAAIHRGRRSFHSARSEIGGKCAGADGGRQHRADDRAPVEVFQNSFDVGRMRVSASCPSGWCAIIFSRGGWYGCCRTTTWQSRACTRCIRIPGTFPPRCGNSSISCASVSSVTWTGNANTAKKMVSTRASANAIVSLFCSLEIDNGGCEHV